MTAAPAPARAASCSGRTLDGPQPKRPSEGSRSVGIRRSAGVVVEVTAPSVPEGLLPAGPPLSSAWRSGRGSVKLGSVSRPSEGGIHPAWSVAAVTFLALVGAAGFRAVPGVLMDPLHDEFGWSVATISLAVAVNMALYGLTAPFAAALMERFGIRRVVTAALLVVCRG